MCYVCFRRFSSPFRRDMSVLALLLVAYSLNSATSFQHRLVKRIIDGDRLLSQDDFSTYHYIELRKSWNCISNQAIHALGGCLTSHFCGGTLIHNYFVLTAGHCLTYQEFFLRNISEVFNLKAYIKELARQHIGWFDSLHFLVKVFLLNPKYRHEMYSNIALLGGSVDFLGMTQKRHAKKVFHHPYYGVDDENQDVALIQSCEPFQRTVTVRPAPIKPLDQLAAQWESIAKRMPACIYVGFGFTNVVSTSHGLNVDTRYMQYTWRHVTCSMDCNGRFQWDEPRRTCALCSRAIPQSTRKMGIPAGGDSGSPIVCDGWYIGIHTATQKGISRNISTALGFPLSCIDDAITPSRLSYYIQSVPEDRGYHTLGPINFRYYQKLRKNPK